MGKVVNLDQAQGRATAAKRSAARPRRRGPRRSKTALVLGGGGFTGGVYEIGALRALDLLAGEPHGQRVRRLRRHERRLLRGGPRGQRDHARGDDARRQPAGSDALPRHRRRHGPAAQPARLRQDRGAAALAHGQARPPPRAAVAPGQRDGHRARARRRPAVRPLLGHRDRDVRAQRPLGPRSLRRLPRAGPRALPRGHGPRHLRADRLRRRRLGRRADLARRARLDGAADGLQARPGRTTASSSTAASSRRRTSTSRWRRAPSSSSS